MKEPIEELFKNSLGGHSTPYNPDAWSAMKAKLDAVMPAAGAAEEAVKNSLDGHEMPYNPEAWNAMKAKLDAKMPVSKPSSNWKYYLVAASVVAVGLTSYFLYNHYNENTTAQNQVIPPVNTNPTTDENATQTQNQSGTTANVSPNTAGSNDVNSIDGNVTNGNTPVANNHQQTNQASNHSQTPANGGNHSTHQPTNGNDETAANTAQNGNRKPTGQNGNSGEPANSSHSATKNMVMPTVGSLCMNEVQSVTNQNDQAIVIALPNGSDQVIQPGRTVQFKPVMAGVHRMGYYDKHDHFIEASTFKVNSLPEVHFSIDRVNKWNKGLPSTIVQTDVAGQSYVWRSGKQVYYGNEAEFHFFQKGTKTIQLEVSNGICTNVKTQQVRIDEDYNLAAMNAFNPNSSDIKNSTFMPYALTERNVKFTMMIIDPRDGGIVYQTKDATQGWDGIDRRTGRQENTTTTYIWKVVLEDREPGERGEYQGTVTKL